MDAPKLKWHDLRIKERKMFRRFLVLSFAMALGACQTAGEKTSKIDDLRVIATLINSVCINNVGNGAEMVRQAEAVSDGVMLENDIDLGGGKVGRANAYRFFKDGKYYALVSIVDEGSVCGVMSSAYLASRDDLLEVLPIKVIDGTYKNIRYGVVGESAGVASVSIAKGGDEPLTVFALMDQEAYEHERSMTGAPRIKWGR